MSTRSRNDLIGCNSRLQSTLSSWREKAATVQEAWNDETAKEFHSQSLGDIEPVITRMIASLQEAIELVRSFEKKVVDPNVWE
jgi:uncharacterized protein YukE